MADLPSLNLTKLVGSSSDAALQYVTSLPHEGLICLLDNYCYLKISDDYIGKIFPFMDSSNQVEMPDYFSGTEPIGAHISVVYPEENTVLPDAVIGQCHPFVVTGLIQAQLGKKLYFALEVHSPSLTLLRQQHNLDPLPTFKGQKIVFHITVAVKTLQLEDKSL